MRAAWLAVPVLLLTACSSLGPRVPARAWPLPDPSLGTLQEAVTQRLRLDRGDKGMDLLAVLEPIPGGIQLAGLTLVGQRVLLIQWDAKGMRVEMSPQVPTHVDPAAVLRDVVLTYWPIDALQAALQGSAWSLEVGAEGTRSLYHQGRPWIRVEALEHGHRVLHVQEGYSVEATDVED